MNGMGTGLVELASVRQVVAAPVAAVWAIVADFARPQQLAATIDRCESVGSGSGAVRTVYARGLVIRERLLEADEAAGRFRYEVLPSGDMPAPALTRYVATVLLRPLSPTQTEVEWRSEGAVSEDLAPVADQIQALYAGAIARIAALTSEAAQ